VLRYFHRIWFGKKPHTEIIQRGTRPDELEKSNMPFLDHLEELRKRIIISLGCILVFMIASFAFSNIFIKWLLYPPIIIPDVPPPIELMTPVITRVQGLMVVRIQVGLIAGIMLSLPVLLSQLWLFISPGLKRSERRYAVPLVFTGTICFLIGAAFAYLIVIPIALHFLLTMGQIDPSLGIEVQNMIDLQSYLGFVTTFMLISGLTFELPLLSYFLTKIGVLSPVFMRKYWRHAIITSLTLSAIITPTTDMVTLFVVAVPMIVLYEISIWVSRLVVRRKGRKNA